VRCFAFHGNAPLDIGARDGKIAEPAFDKGYDFVAAGIGLDEIGLGVVEIKQAVLEGGELEEEVFFGDRLGGTAAIGTRVAGLGVVDVEVVKMQYWPL
jgi:hypothetical protein